MKLLPQSLQALVAELSKLPGVGQRTALRYSVALIQGGPKRTEILERALSSVAREVGHCPHCHFWAQEAVCPICTDSERQNDCICVVRDCPDVLALEGYQQHSWKYHVLQGLLAPMSGRGPGQIRIESLFRRLEGEKIEEVIFALDSTLEGDATAMYIRDQLKNRYPHIRLSRVATGLPAGSSVEYVDSRTLEVALNHRTTMIDK